MLHNVCLMKGDEINVEMIEDTEVINCAMDNNENMHDAANAGQCCETGRVFSSMRDYNDR